MTDHYRLYPPFLHIPEQQDFAKAWEHFCCKLLNISNSTTEIYVRNPPENGVDIYYPAKKIAYQCKSVESAKSGDFNVTKAVESIQSAFRIKEELGWEHYALCTNVAITGGAETTLKKELPSIDLLTASHWIRLCEIHPLEVERNFRRLLDIPPSRLLDAFRRRFIATYSEELQDKLTNSPFDIFLYSNRHDTTYRLTVSGAFTCHDLLSVFREFFRLPETADIGDEAVHVSLRHSVVFDGHKIPLSKTLAEAGIGQGAVVTYWTTMVWRDAQETFEGDVIHMMTSTLLQQLGRSLHERKEVALNAFDLSVKECFAEFDRALEHDAF